jgi:hypothetical protein
MFILNHHCPRPKITHKCLPLMGQNQQRFSQLQWWPLLNNNVCTRIPNQKVCTSVEKPFEKVKCAIIVSLTRDSQIIIMQHDIYLKGMLWMLQVGWHELTWKFDIVIWPWAKQWQNNFPSLLTPMHPKGLSLLWHAEKQILEVCWGFLASSFAHRIKWPNKPTYIVSLWPQRVILLYLMGTYEDENCFFVYYIG